MYTDLLMFGNMKHYKYLDGLYSFKGKVIYVKFLLTVLIQKRCSVAQTKRKIKPL